MRNLRAPTRTATVFLVVILAVSALPTWGRAKEGGPTPLKLASFVVPQGETRKGDAYVCTNTVTIAGTLDGDLAAGASVVEVTGTVTGDIYAAGNMVTLQGKVGDSVRVWGNNLLVAGTIDGDLIAFCATATLAPGAHVTGDVLFYGGQLTVQGTVDGKLKAKGGEVTLGGKIGGDANVTCDAIAVADSARIGGDLHYTSRNQLELEGKGIVAGDTDYKERKKEEKGKPALSWGTVFKKVFSALAAFVVGLVLLRVFRGPARAVVATLDSDLLRSGGVGFISGIVAPVAAVILCVLIITIPLAVILLLLFVVTVYVAKLPVAVWLGRKILQKLGRIDPSPYGSLLLGVLLLYVLFTVPCAGKILWFVCVFLGIGAMILGTREHRRSPKGTMVAPAPLETSAPPSPAAP